MSQLSCLGSVSGRQEKNNTDWREILHNSWWPFFASCAAAAPIMSRRRLPPSSGTSTQTVPRMIGSLAHLKLLERRCTCGSFHKRLPGTVRIANGQRQKTPVSSTDPASARCVVELVEFSSERHRKLWSWKDMQQDICKWDAYCRGQFQHGSRRLLGPLRSTGAREWPADSETWSESRCRQLD